MRFIVAPLLLLLAVVAVQEATALQCYASSQDSKTPRLEEQADWQYCVYQQMLYTADNGSTSRVTASTPAYFGATPDIMDLAPAQAVFADSEPPIKVIGFCVLEKFDYGASAPNVKREFALRCLCATAGCNKGANMRQLTSHNIRLNA